MKPFIHEDFLLENDVAVDLYHRYAKDLPIVDYHCHLPVDQIARDHRFSTLTEIWLEGDHYKWRAMRTAGVGEEYCSGSADPWDKFQAWARTVPQTLGNPLFHWVQMELARPFGIHDLLGPDSARRIYDHCNALLQRPEFTTLGLLRGFKVAVVCTTDDPTDSLEHHEALAARADPDTQVYPTWRPDKALAVEDPAAWNAWVERLEHASGVSIGSFESLLAALERRHDAFHAAGCRASDHGLETLYSVPHEGREVAAVFDAVRRGQVMDEARAIAFKSALLYRLALLDHKRGWVQQFHLGALRNNNTRMRRLIGADSGFDSIGDFEQARPLARFLDSLDATNQLAKTILYNNNPGDNMLLASMIGNFQDGSVPGKMQYGAAWWFLDQKDGNEAQIRDLANLGLLSRFVGMVTDSRSFLSYSRHEYFRRILCNFLGVKVRKGEIPDDRVALGRLVRDVGFFNAKAYFVFELGRLGREV
jgi:glucuronate isomerase